MKRRTEPTWMDGRCYFEELPGWVITKNGRIWQTFWCAEDQATDWLTWAQDQDPGSRYELLPWTTDLADRTPVQSSERPPELFE